MTTRKYKLDPVQPGRKDRAIVQISTAADGSEYPQEYLSLPRDTPGETAFEIVQVLNRTYEAGREDRAAELPPKVLMGPKIFAWDWKEQPPLHRIASLVGEISAGGTRVYMREYQTGSDSYALIVSTREVSDEEADRLGYDDEGPEHILGRLRTDHRNDATKGRGEDIMTTPVGDVTEIAEERLARWEPENADQFLRGLSDYAGLAEAMRLGFRSLESQVKLNRQISETTSDNLGQMAEAAARLYSLAEQAAEQFHLDHKFWLGSEGEY